MLPNTNLPLSCPFALCSGGGGREPPRRYEQQQHVREWDRPSTPPELKLQREKEQVGRRPFSASASAFEQLGLSRQPRCEASEQHTSSTNAQHVAPQGTASTCSSANTSCCATCFVGAQRLGAHCADHYGHEPQPGERRCSTAPGPCHCRPVGGQQADPRFAQSHALLASCRKLRRSKCLAFSHLWVPSMTSS